MGCMKRLVEKLVAFRDREAQKNGVESYKVLQYATIESIARSQPKTLTELGKIRGIGPQKLKKYGDIILTMVHGAETQAQEQEPVLLKTEKQTVRVSEYLDYLNLVFKRTADVKILGEISRLDVRERAVYMTLVDTKDGSVLDCVMWTSVYRGLAIPLEEGLEVTVEGEPEVYKPKGKFSLKVNNVALAGDGALKKAYELLKVKLEQEGIFRRKRPLPECIRTIGVITSKAGAVLSDFKNNLEQRGLTVFVKDARVEGAEAVSQVIAAVKFFNHAMPALDCLVVMRGGGSLEDLQAFNNEQLVRTVFASKLPTIVAIGHDRDLPLAQMAADIDFCSTPTAAAEVINASWQRLVMGLPELSSKLVYAYERELLLASTKVSRISDMLIGKLNTVLETYRRVALVIQSNINSYLAWISGTRGVLEDVRRRILGVMQFQLKAATSRVAAADKFLQTASPERNLTLGYSIVRNKSGKVLKSVAGASVGEHIQIQVTDGTIESEVNSTEKSS